MKKLFFIYFFLPVVFLCGISTAGALAQGRAVTGTVTDEQGAAMSGVTVLEKGTTNGVLTDRGGRYTINLTGNEATLVFSFLGYVTGEVEVAGRWEISITMKEDSRSIEQVVVVGFGTQRKENLTGAVSVLDSKAFEARPVNNAVQALQGMMTGLNITQTSGMLNSRASLDVRGVGTIGQGSRGGALILIDGMEGDLYTINPQDIESISVLKDAAASSIYGAKAPFGVILITTKKGRSGKASVSYNANFRYSAPINMPSQMDSYSFATYFNDAARNGGQGEYFSGERLQRILYYKHGVIKETTIAKPSNPLLWDDGYNNGNDNMDYYKVYYKSIVASQDHNVSVSGGDDRMTYYLSGNFLNQGGQLNFGDDGLKRFNLRGNFEGEVSRHVRIGYNATFVREDYHQPSAMTDSFFTEIGRQSWPVKPLYDPNGNLFDDWVMRFVDGGQVKQQTTTFAQQVKIVAEPVKGWRIVGEANYRSNIYYNHHDVLTVHQKGVDGVLLGSSWNPNSRVFEHNDKLDYLNVNAYTDYEKTLGGHNFKVMAGFQMDESKYRDLEGTKNGVMVADYPYLNTTSGLDQNGNPVSPTLAGGYTNWATAGFFGRLNYDYKGRYLIEGNIRYDGSSRFRRDNRWGWFPSVSAGWNIANEQFMEPVGHIVGTLKLRGSYGSLGNQSTSAVYPTYSMMNYGIGTGTWLIDGVKSNIAWPASLISTSLTWETVKSWNVGFDFGLLKNRLTGSFDYFVRNTKNMVGPDNELPIILGTAVPSTNNTDLKTYGFEIEAAWRDRLACGLGYGVRFVLSDSQSEIMSYSNPSGNIGTYYKGMKLGEIWGYETLGIARTDAEMSNHLGNLYNGGQSGFGSNWGAGDIMYKDLNGDGVIDWGSSTIDDHGDMRIIGNNTPRYNYGIDINLDYKGFDFRMFLQGTGRRDYFQTSMYFWGSMSGGLWTSAALKQHQNYFRNDPDHYLGENLDAYYARPVWGSNKNRQVQTRYLQNAAYMRIKNIQIGYTLPKSFTHGVRARVYFSGENLFTFTKMSNLFDPETIGGYGNNRSGNVYPLTKIYSFGVNISF